MEKRTQKMVEAIHYFDTKFKCSAVVSLAVEDGRPVVSVVYNSLTDVYAKLVYGTYDGDTFVIDSEMGMVGTLIHPTPEEMADAMIKTYALHSHKYEEACYEIV